MPTTVTTKGQVTIPKRVRDHLGIRPGAKVEFQRLADGQIVLVKMGPQKEKISRFAGLRGHAGKGLSTDAIMALTRGRN